MQTHTFSPCLTALLGLSAAIPGTFAAAPPLSECLKALGRMQSATQEREAAAEAAAVRFTAGGRLWVSGSIPRFDIEWKYRAGGVACVAVLKNVADLVPGAVLAYGCMEGAEAGDTEFLRAARAKGAFTLAFGPATAGPDLRESADGFLSNGLVAEMPMREQFGASLCMAQLWAFTGELIAACTRAGKMPAMLQSVMVPGARERNARYRQGAFHEDMVVPPVAAGLLGGRYLTAISKAVTGLVGAQARLRHAGLALQRTVQAGGTVFHANMGHFEPHRLLARGFPVPLAVLPSKEPERELAVKASAGDALLIVWYTDMPDALLRSAREKGVVSVCMVAANPDAPHDTAAADVFVDPQWRMGDTAVEVPGYDVPILPPSGVLNSLVFYGILAEAVDGLASPGTRNGR